MEKKQQADVKTIARNAGVSGLGDIFSALVLFGTNILMTRTVGASLYGTFVLARNTAFIGGILGNFGLQQGVLHFLPFYRGKEDWGRARGALSSSTRLTVLFSLGTAALLFLYAHPIAQGIFNTPAMAPALRVLAFSVPPLAFSKLWQSGIRSFQVLKYSVLVGKVVRPTMNLVLLSLLFLAGLRLYSLLFSELLSVFFAAGLALYFLKRLLPTQWKQTRAVSDRRELLGFSAPLFLVEALNFIMMKVDVIMIGIFLMAQQVGIYNAAARVTMLLLIPLASVNSIFAPMIAEYHGRDDLLNLRRNFKVATRWVFSLVFPLCLVVFLSPTSLLRLFGPEFTAGSKALLILAGGQLVNASVGPAGFMITMTGHPKLTLVNSLSLALTNVVLNLILIPRFGIVGAAVATASSVAAINILRLVEVHHILKVHPYRWDFVKPLASGILAATVTYILFLRSTTTPPPLMFVLGMLVLLFTYSAAMALLRLPEEDKVVLKALRARLRLKG